MNQNKNYIFKQLKFPDLYESVIIFLYLFSFLIFSLSLINLFKEIYVLLAFVLSLVILIFLKPKIKLEKNHLALMGLIPLILIGFVLFRGYFSSDAISSWLPWAKEIVLNQKMPLFLNFSASEFSTNREPLLSLFLALIFLINSQANLSLLVVPLIFNVLTFIFLYRWSRFLKIDKSFLIFASLLLLTNYQLSKYASNIIQESLILFFFVAFFYFFDIYLQTKDSKYFLFLMATANLALMSKISGGFLIFPLIFIFFKDKLYKNKDFYFSLFLFWPVGFWFLRKWLIFKNIFYPLFIYTRGPYNFVVEQLKLFRAGRFHFTDYPSVFLLKILAAFPMLIAAVWGLIKKKRFIILIMILAFLLVEFRLDLGVRGNPRHLYAILGILIVYGLVGIIETKSKLFLSLLFFLGILPVLSIQPSYSASKFLAPLEASLIILGRFNEFLYQNFFIVSLILAFIFYLFYGRKKTISKFLILTVFCLNLLNDSVIQVSWLNIWLPILGFLLLFFILLFIRDNYQQKIVRNLFIIFIAAFLTLNSMGLTTTNFLAHKKFSFPKLDLFINEKIIAEQIQKMEGQNKDFYIAIDVGGNLNWLFGYNKTLDINGSSFAYKTAGGYRLDMSSEELQVFLKINNFKYVVRGGYELAGDFWGKMNQSSKYYELIYNQAPLPDKENIKIWRLKD